MVIGKPQSQAGYAGPCAGGPSTTLGNNGTAQTELRHWDLP
jgi:hypothetical protein